jgi:hypothetical protein
MSSLAHRRRAVSSVTNEIGVYVLSDLDNVPIYVGQSTDGIRSRVSRHLTSARSDIIANRQLDVWEVAYVWAYPTARDQIAQLEATLFHHFDQQSPLFNGTLPRMPAQPIPIPEPTQIVQVLLDEEIEQRRNPALRLPRQAEHYSQIVGHFLVVKNSRQIARSIHAHFRRLSKYHHALLGLAEDVDEGES